MNCKPGDLAIVIRGIKVDSPHAGKIVEVISAHSMNKTFGQIWNVRVSAPIITHAVTRGGKDLGQKGFSMELQSPDDWLRPLPGLDEPESTETTLLAPIPEKETA